jgi:hypothetical protein
MLALAQRKPTLPTFVLVRASTGSGSMPVCSHRPCAMRWTRRRSELDCCGCASAPAACFLPTLPSSSEEGVPLRAGRAEVAIVGVVEGKDGA